MRMLHIHPDGIPAIPRDAAVPLGSVEEKHRDITEGKFLQSLLVCFAHSLWSDTVQI